MFDKKVVLDAGVNPRAAAFALEKPDMNKVGGKSEAAIVEAPAPGPVGQQTLAVYQTKTQIVVTTA